MHGTRFELGSTTAKEPKLGVGIEAAKAYPSSEKEIPPRQRISIERRIALQQHPNLLGQWVTQGLVRIEREHPVTAAFFQRGVLLRSKALPLLQKKPGAKFASN